MSKEIIKITDLRAFGDETGDGPWEVNGETYTFVETYRGEHCDGECHNVIVKRESDDKLFKFTWRYYRDNYYFNDPELEEVTPKTITKTIYE